MASVHTTILILLSVWMTLQTGLGFPLSGGPDAGGAEGVPRVRNKRCSCTNQLDSECHYFCHLDIIWVNTPSKTTVYGLGSALSRRRRRSVGRCSCANPADHTCSRFCFYSSENPAIVLVKPWQSEQEAETSVLTVQRSPQASGPEQLAPQEPLNGARSEALTLIRELIRDSSLVMEEASHPRKRAPWALKPAYT
ncbi:hypothetical protein AALO_G00180100 [Alosa alosa]|uniref:Endothelin-like toxin domain-containing protein n=1 Tax=Alosa alosa TaxID=278164 RepID=A0AAV6GDM6_9TELE|nr:endothelin-2 [Alosa sapidissima]XP_048117196.1 endothelin-2 [Alosa alosa]KAG5271462.1 hypothetical protein AALO_G00180100 [Alosa alosa]